MTARCWAPPRARSPHRRRHPAWCRPAAGCWRRVRCTPAATSCAESMPNQAVSCGGVLVRPESRGTNRPRSDAGASPPRSKCSRAGTPSQFETTTPPMRRRVTRPSGRTRSTSKATSSMCARKAIGSRSGPAVTIRLPIESTTATRRAHGGRAAMMASRTRHSWPGTPGRSANCMKRCSRALWPSVRGGERAGRRSLVARRCGKGDPAGDGGGVLCGGVRGECRQQRRKDERRQCAQDGVDRRAVTGNRRVHGRDREDGCRAHAHDQRTTGVRDSTSCRNPRRASM
jgi:hypothetical protein